MKTCLVVDDSEVVRKVALRIFETLNLEAAEAESGQDALDLCAKNMPDGILLDSYMPPMATVEFLASLRALANGSKPVVIYCATENDSTRDRPRPDGGRRRLRPQALRSRNAARQVRSHRPTLIGSGRHGSPPRQTPPSPTSTPACGRRDGRAASVTPARISTKPTTW